MYWRGISYGELLWTCGFVPAFPNERYLMQGTDGQTSRTTRDSPQRGRPARLFPPRHRPRRSATSRRHVHPKHSGQLGLLGRSVLYSGRVQGSVAFLSFCAEIGTKVVRTGESKAYAEDIIEATIQAFQDRLPELIWLDEATRHKAQEKVGNRSPQMVGTEADQRMTGGIHYEEDRLPYLAQHDGRGVFAALLRSAGTVQSRRSFRERGPSQHCGRAADVQQGWQVARQRRVGDDPERGECLL